jgi:hypothetical protein
MDIRVEEGRLSPVISLNKDTRENRWGHTMVVKCRHQSHTVRKRISPRVLGEILRERTKKTQKDMKTTLLVPQQNYGKDNYTINLTGQE